MNKAQYILKLLHEWKSGIKIDLKKDVLDKEAASQGESRWVVLIPQLVVGKSAGPKGMTRKKPVKYSKAEELHAIVYVYDFFGSTAHALAEHKRLDKEMAMVSRTPKGEGVKTYVTQLHNISDDKNMMSGGTNLNPVFYNWRDSLMWQGEKVYTNSSIDNAQLVRMKLIPNALPF